MICSTPLFRQKSHPFWKKTGLAHTITNKDTLKVIEEFAGKQISFDYVTVAWLKKFEKHLLSTGRNYTTIGMRCRAIRAIMNKVLSMGIIKEKQYPFGNGP